MRILLTGGAGYVGSACLRWLLRHGHDAIAFDNLSEGNRESVPTDRLIAGDILEPDSLRDAMEGQDFDVVMHFAALASVPESVVSPERYWQTNLEGTRNLLEVMRQVGTKRLVFSSTAATYSFAAPMPLVEDADQLPRVPYGTSKLAAEWLIKDYARAFGIGYAILRYFNASGADADGSHGEARRGETHLIPLIFQTALGRREKLLVYGDSWSTADGTCVRDYVHVEDLAEAHRLAAEALQPGSHMVYNVGTGRGHSVLEVLRACEQTVGRSIPYGIAEPRRGDPATLVASPARLKTELGWRPRYENIVDIAATAWRWHEDFPHGYKSLAHAK